MLLQYELIRNKIKHIYDNNELKACISEIMNYLSILNKLKGVDIDRDLWFCYFMLAKSYKNIFNYKTSIMYAEKSLEYTLTESDKIQTYWLLAVCYENLPSYKLEAIEYYDKCIDYYKNNDLLLYELCVRSNKAVLENDELESYRVICFYLNNFKTADDEYLDGMYENLFKIQYNNQQRDKALKTLKKIKNNSIIQKHSDKMIAF